MRKMITCFRAKKHGEVEKETALIRNGRILLEKSISFNNGRGNPIRCFSVKDLNNATNNYDKGRVFWDDEFYILYNGFLQCRPIIVKKEKEHCRSVILKMVKDPNENCFNEIVLASQVSCHKNVLKLLGCCLETELPILVFESAENGTLHDRIHSLQISGFRPLPWKDRLKIAVGAANAIAYLHTAFPRPIIHMDVKPSNILLDQDYAPNLTDFYLSRSIPEDQSHVEHGLHCENVPIWALKYRPPEFFSRGTINEKSDVYSFGVVLLSLLTGKRPEDYFPSVIPEEKYSLVDGLKAYMETEKYSEVLVDSVILEEGTWPGIEQQLQNVALLALECTCDLEDNRPSITEVAKKLRQIYQSSISNS